MDDKALERQGHKVPGRLQNDTGRGKLVDAIGQSLCGNVRKTGEYKCKRKE